jgi:hypothetical protein
MSLPSRDACAWKQQTWKQALESQCHSQCHQSSQVLVMALDLVKYDLAADAGMMASLQCH